MKKTILSIFAIAMTFFLISNPVISKAAPLSTLADGEVKTQLYVKTDGGNLNVREYASLSAPIVGKLRNGTPIIEWSIFSTTNDGYTWTHVHAYDINNVLIGGWVADPL